MVAGLSVDRVSTVTLNVAPTAVAGRNFGEFLAITDTDVVDVVERIRYYLDLESVGNDHGLDSEVYKAMSIYYAQIPQPVFSAVGRWARVASSGILHGGFLTPTQQLMTNFNSITTGALSIKVDGVAKVLTAIDLSGTTTLSGVAAAVQAAITPIVATVVWDGQRFNVTSSSTGATSTLNYATPAPAGIDLGPLLGLTAGVANVPVPGVTPETALAALSACYNMSSSWYGCEFAVVAGILSDADHLNNAAFLEGVSISRMYGFTTFDSTILDPTSTIDIGSELAAVKYSKTSWLFSSTPYAHVGMYGRAFSVNWQGSDTALTLKFKQIIGVPAETLSETEANALEAKGGNVYVNYNNGAAILEQGVMANGRFFDEVHGLDALQNQCQNDQWNAFAQNLTKFPQTDPGVTTLMTVLDTSLAVFVTNGFIAPGVWNASGFGQLSQGDTLPKGYYTYAPPVSTQTQAVRETRVTPLMQSAIKLAGALHSSDVLINVNR